MENYISGTLLLFSGGIDSTVCLKLLKDQDLAIETLFLDYGQVSASMEYQSAAQIANYYGVRLDKIHVNTSIKFYDDVIRGRNAFLVLTALMYSNFESGTIALGIHSGTNYVDCTTRFTNEIQRVVDLYCNGQIRVDTPLISFSKDEIWQLALQKNIPVNKTYSCELGLEQPCRKCKSCLDLLKLYEL